MPGEVPFMSKRPPRPGAPFMPGVEWLMIGCRVGDRTCQPLPVAIRPAVTSMPQVTVSLPGLLPMLPVPFPIAGAGEHKTRSGSWGPSSVHPRLAMILALVSLVSAALLVSTCRQVYKTESIIS